MQNLYFECGMKTFEIDPIGYLEYLKHDRVMTDTSDLHEKIQNRYLQNIDYETKKNAEFIFKSEDQDDYEYVNEYLDKIFEVNLDFYEIMYKYVNFKFPNVKFSKIFKREEIIKRDFLEIQKILSLTKNKFTIDDFMTVYTKKKLKSDLSEMLKEFEELNIIDGNKLIIVLFDCIKRRSDFNSIIIEFSRIQSDFKITQTIFFIYIFKHSNQQLRTLLFTSCLQFMAIPLTTLDPWDFDHITQFPKRIIFSEIVHGFEKSKAILQVKIYKNHQNKNIQYCSSFLNQLFGKSFQMH